MDVHISEMIKAFRAQGHEVILVAPSLGAQDFGGGGGWVDAIRSRLPRFVGEILELGYNLAAYRNLSRAIQAERPDAIYERYALFLLAGIWAKRRFRLPLVLEINSPLFAERRDHGGLSLRAIGRWCESWAWRNADACLPVTHVLAKDVRDAGVPDTRITVIPNGIDPAEFSEQRDGSGVRGRYGLEGKLVLGFTGFVRPWHGLDRIIRAIAEFGPSANIHLLVVGDGPARASLEELARELAVSDRLTFTGVVQRADMATHIAAFDIALQPDATAYASPLKLVEYMAMGKAIIAPDQPNIRELLDHERTGLLFASSDPEGMRKALLRLIEEKDLRETLGHAAAAEVRQRPLTWASNATRVVRILKGLAKTGA
jgi:glycosyltransferase involved in cell wall biosynthesis